MNDSDHADLVFRISALERLITWLAAQEVKRGGEPESGLQRMSDELHALLDASQAPNLAIQQMQEVVAARIDDLVQATRHEVHRASGGSKPPASS